MIIAADDRFRSSSDGIESWHCFSAGGHYDPDNIAHGPVVGVDEHHVVPGSGFDWHSHRGVTIVSYVVAGRLRHEDDAGRVRRIGAGEVLVQRTGGGIRHCEVNASKHDPLRLVQLTLVGGGERSEVSASQLPVDVDDACVEVWTGDGSIRASRWVAFVAAGEWHHGDATLVPGDSVRGAGEFAVTGSGELLVLSER